ncbi:2-oxoglutarate dehydrogenase complex dihydrolipoyllysine-residue succinyltransferase [Runella salmonicolor]|uniref:Dihydrolipoyllysine-residue succinyltransferase component of 2-oxoglutarate dehydrogenase complex n=1 Tax=Runella salmonicolor TaxID=2950278 RepID=A0ABT1FI05_9BACT|nr:2-oxoglutarate dehydrogenase complex dihydrolipoyllysine-residue succinyltransferase [Runella salmonicolor]MCP1381400.1 2-oxoglutarate dehydrogenase complex dihydrolipoyllysine-residue succinyltransferase [Runella salmonicolor]
MSQIEIKVPTVGESITEVTIGSWVKKDGESVKRDEVICSLDSDKASFDVVSEADGVLRVKAQEGDVLPIGGLICVIETSAEVASAPASTPAPVASAPAPVASASVAPATAAKVVEMKVPTVGESVTEVTIASWNKKDGDTVQLDEVLCELESDKATFELPAEAAGVLRIVAEAGSTLSIGAVICKIEVGAGSAAASAPVAEAPQSNGQAVTANASNDSYAAGHPSPAAAKILAEKGIDPASVAGSGVGGRLTKEDAIAAQPKAAPTPTPAEQPKAPVAAPAAPAPAPKAADARGQRRVKMTSLRKTIARRLVAVKNETAMLTTFNEVDMKPIMDLRNKYKDKFKEKHGVGLGFMSFFTRACAVALQEFPVVNAFIDGDEVVYNDFSDISIAVSTERGLVVPVIRNAEKMTFSQIEKEIIRLAGLARDNKLTIDQMQGGTFTITNGGIFGSMLSTPIINAPQAAILGMHNIVERAVVVNGEIVIRPIMYVALSYDHRTIDGRDSVSFLVRVKQLLEDPTRLLLEV